MFAEDVLRFVIPRCLVSGCVLLVGKLSGLSFTLQFFLMALYGPLRVIFIESKTA